MPSKSNIKIFVAYHKKSPIIKTECLIPIQVGRALSKEKLDMIGDDTGDNISIKNPNYCELTALYWMWKNVEADYYGLFHYRRLFDFKNNDKQFFSNFSGKMCNRFGWNDKEIRKYCENFDVISAPILDIHPPGESNKIISAYELYEISHSALDLNKTIKIIKEKYPNFFDSTIEYLSQNKSSYFNMVIMKKEIFHDYCKWLFSILFELEKQISISKDKYQSRVFGFIGERLLNIYINQLKKNKKHKIKEVTNIVEINFEKENKCSLFYNSKMFLKNRK